MSTTALQHARSHDASGLASSREKHQNFSKSSDLRFVNECTVQERVCAALAHWSTDARLAGDRLRRFKLIEASMSLSFV
jgi:hypothetical protein